VGIPVIALFGRSQPGLGPKRWGPDSKKSVVIHKDIGCLDCPAHNCRKGFLCVQAITVDDVVAAAEKLLSL
jgi:ADP-heptose:LPS heptosyltransferase